MELKNKRTMYDVTNVDTVVKLSGSFTYTMDDRISDFNGNFSELNDSAFVGGFSFSEREGDLVNKNTNSVKKALQENCDQLLDDTIDLIKVEMKK